MPQVPGRTAGGAFLGEKPGGQPGRRQGLRPDLPGALVDEAGPGRQRRLAHRVAAQGEDDPFGHAQPGRRPARPDVRWRAARAAWPGWPGSTRAGRWCLRRPRRTLEPPGPVVPSQSRRGDRTRRSPERPAARPRRAARRSRPARSRRRRAPGWVPRRIRPPGRRWRLGPRPRRRGGTGRSRSGRGRRCATGSAARRTGLAGVATPARPRPWRRWCRCRGRRRRWRSWVLLPRSAFDEPGRHPDALDGQVRLAQARQQPRRGYPADLVTGMVHDGDGRTQGIGHGEIAERDEADVRPPG